MRQAMTLLAFLGGSATMAAAQPITYDFAGTLGDHFAPFIDEGEVASSQSGGVLRFDTGNVVTTTDPVDAYAHTSFSPSYTESWTVSIEFDLPLVYDTNFTPNATIDQEIVLGIAAIFTAGDTTWNSVSSSFEVFNPGSNFGPIERQYYSDVVTDDIDGDENWVLSPGVTTGTLVLFFDAITKVLTASNGDGVTIVSADIDDPATDWGMTDTDSFTIGIFGAANRRAVLSSTPITMDNFSGEINADASYDFAGVLGDHFTPFFDGAGMDSAQTGGELVFDTNDIVIPTDTGDAYAHNSFAPRFDQSWTASVEFELPLTYDSNFSPTESVEQFVGLGLAAIFDDGINPISLVDTTIEVWHGTEPGAETARELGVFWNFQEGPEDLWQGADGSGITNGTLTLTFNADTKVITATSGGVTIGSYDLDAPGTDWGMGDSDTFGIGIYGGAENRAIFDADPLTLDNFYGSVIPTPEPVCMADTNGDGILDNGDIGTFVQLFLSSDPAADMNGDSILDNGDISGFVQFFLAGCP